MRARRRTLIPSGLALTFVALLVTPVVTIAASGLPAALSMDPSTAGPGASVLISGTDFPPGADIALELGTPAGERTLGSVTAGEGGHFGAALILPGDAEPGAWRLMAVAADGTSASYAFNAGPAVPGAVVSAAVVEDAEPALASGNSLSDIVVMLVVAVLIAAGIGGAGYIYLQLKMTNVQPGMAVGEDPIWSGASRADDPAETATDEPAWLEARPDSRPTES